MWDLKIILLIKLQNDKQKFKKVKKINRNKSIDVRSYKLFAGKLLSVGFKKSKSANDAINDLIQNFNNKKIKDRNTNLRSIFLKEKI